MSLSVQSQCHLSVASAERSESAGLRSPGINELNGEASSKLETSFALETYSLVTAQLLSPADSAHIADIVL